MHFGYFFYCLCILTRRLLYLLQYERLAVIVAVTRTRWVKMNLIVAFRRLC